jgi:hypothetical protein
MVEALQIICLKDSRFALTVLSKTLPFYAGGINDTLF